MHVCVLTHQAQSLSLLIHSYFACNTPTVSEKGGTHPMTSKKGKKRKHGREERREREMKRERLGGRG